MDLVHPIIDAIVSLERGLERRCTPRRKCWHQAEKTRKGQRLRLMETRDRCAGQALRPFDLCL